MSRTSFYPGKMERPTPATLTPFAFRLLKRLEKKLKLTRSDVVERGIRELAIAEGLGKKKR